MPQTPPPLPDWNAPKYADALARRDVGAIFRAAKEAGWTQRRIAHAVDMGQSEISDILRGRQVINIRVLERIAQGLSVPPGRMGLAYTEGSPARPAVEPPDLVRHSLRVMLGEATERAGYLLAPTTEYRNVGRADAHVINEYFLAIQRIEQQHSGQLVPAQGLIRQIQNVLRASMPDDVRARLSRMEGWVNSFAGWCAIDAGNFDLGMSHFSTALEIAGRYDDHLGKCRALFSAGKAEMHYGEPDNALKLFQLAVIPANIIGSKLYDAGLAAHSAWAVGRLGADRVRHVDRYVGRTWDAYDAVRPEREYEGMHSFFNRTDILGVTGQAQVAHRPERAVTDLRACLSGRKPGSRSAAFETATLAHAYLSAGYADKAAETGREALSLVQGIRSARKAVRLAPLKIAAYSHGSRDLTDLAEDIRRAN
jgi:transcriptional regulator with XRE-family HTH domain